VDPERSNVSVRSLHITEIFYSIQGESTFAGKPCIFIRLTGCSLRCIWCDTTYAFNGGQTMLFPEILKQVTRYQCPLVEITGGEPLNQKETPAFISLLCHNGFQVLLETSGAIDIAPVDRRAHIILDVKCPGSGMADRIHWGNLAQLSSKDEAKFVIQNRRDYEWARDVMTHHHLSDHCSVLLSPVFGALDLHTLAQWILDDRLPVRLQAQLHKFIWEPQARGV